MEGESSTTSFSQPPVLKPLEISSSLSIPNPPMTPMTPTSPNPSAEPKAKKPNPLTDLVDSEKIFVDLLTGIIRKVAGAWSRSNLPPPELDTMFRTIEGIYKANRALYAKLKDISADPKSAGELGGLLIKWIDDLRKPYENYCSKYCGGFNSWQPVQCNPRLGRILEEFSSSNPAPTDSGIWTLDALFILPRARLKYYLKLYNRLLKNTDNHLLVEAVETLNMLIAMLDSRSSMSVGESSVLKPSSNADAEDEVVIDMRNHSLNSPPVPNKTFQPDNSIELKTGSETSSNRGSASVGEMSSRESESTSRSRASTQTLSMPISDLERRLSVERTLDIFTMEPKHVRLQMSPPTLTFTREMRTSLDVVVRFTSQKTGIEVVHQQGHVYLLSDLFLICEHMSPEDQAKPGSEGADMWLCYPPLAGKVLRVNEVAGQDASLEIAIMRKEFLILETDSKQTRDALLRHFSECIEFSRSLPPPSKQLPPPIPALPPFTRGPTDPKFDGRTSGSMSPSSHRSGSPVIKTPAGEQLPPAYQTPDGQLPPNGHGQPPYLRPSASAQVLGRGPPFGPNNGLPPARSTGFMTGPNEPMASQNFGPPYGPPGQPGLNGPAPAPPPHQPMFPGGPHPPMRPPNQHPAGQFIPPQRPPSEPSMSPGIRKSPSTRSLASQYSQQDASGPMPPPLPQFPNAYQHPAMGPPRTQSFATGLQAPQARPLLPSAQARAISMAEVPITEPSPPNSPIQQPQQLGPVVSTVSAQMKCKVFLQQQHAQWKSLGSAKLKLYTQAPTNVKQLVVEADNKDKTVLISTIVLTDGVERVGKTGVAIELSDKGARTGIIYMIQLRNETSAGGLFESLLAGSDRAVR
ncbi:hypothetical protein CVT24_001058 [Panaeolus cyanescens]|uniref:DH domain-containing protein n=1 Tax=Panaeolus cyanescens TaxID=181874 RepID=A0A409VWZ0_9AGAR|nr:hypothetical protein CVT24_001058 [Panaeolus cyanescens]